MEGAVKIWGSCRQWGAGLGTLCNHGHLCQTLSALPLCLCSLLSLPLLSNLFYFLVCEVEKGSKTDLWIPIPNFRERNPIGPLWTRYPLLSNQLWPGRWNHVVQTRKGGEWKEGGAEAQMFSNLWLVSITWELVNNPHPPTSKTTSISFSWSEMGLRNVP